MGIPYVLDRSLYSLKQKSGSLKHTLNITPVSSFPLTGNSWVNNRGQFLFQDKTALTGHKAKEQNEDFLKAYSQILNIFSNQLANEFSIDGNIDWNKIVQHNSSMNLG